jgi:CheY-like chemotaxis protein
MGDAAARHAAHHIVGLESGQQTYRVLIADDRLQNRILVRQLLESIGFEVEEAANGKEAVDLHQRWHPHLVLMDMRMPVMDGYEASQRIKASAGGKATIIVALTASALEEEREAILSAGCDDYVRKPFHDADLLATLGQHLGVRYRLADQEEAATDRDAGPAQEALTPRSLAVLPVETVVELHDAASRARADLIQELAARIEQDHPLLSRGLVQLVDEFRFDKIMALTEQQEGVQ